MVRIIVYSLDIEISKQQEFNYFKLKKSFDIVSSKNCAFNPKRV